MCQEVYIVVFSCTESMPPKEVRILFSYAVLYLSSAGDIKTLAACFILNLYKAFYIP